MKLKTIRISEPRPFRSIKDENYFFEWLKNISEIKSIKRVKGGKLELEITTPVDKYCLSELMAVLCRYSISIRPLAHLCDSDNKEWFCDQSKYWYSDIFEPVK